MRQPDRWNYLKRHLQECTTELELKLKAMDPEDCDAGWGQMMDVYLTLREVQRAMAKIELCDILP